MYIRLIERLHRILTVIFIGILCFASTAAGFLPPNASTRMKLHSTGLLDNTEQIIERRAADCGRSENDEFNDITSRRRALATLAVSAATLFSTPPQVIAKQEQTIPSASLRSASTTNTFMASKTSTLASEPNSFQESISGFVAGAAVSCCKTLVKFPLDTATVRVQMPNSEYSIRDPLGLFNGCFNGVSLTLLSNIPAGAVFFGFKDAVKTTIKNSGDASISTMPKWLSTSIAVGVALVPYWIVRNPSEVVKVRQQANIDGYGSDVSAIDAVKKTMQSSEDDSEMNNISDFYTGYWENILYAYPADVIKFVAYESITMSRKDLTPFEGARAGALATALAQLLTTPLDVVRNRRMTGKNKIGSSASKDEENGYIESLINLGKEEGVSGLFAGATPRIGKAILSGAIQFATYEETKQTMSKILLKGLK